MQIHFEEFTLRHKKVEKIEEINPHAILKINNRKRCFFFLQNIIIKILCRIGIGGEKKLLE